MDIFCNFFSALLPNVDVSVPLPDSTEHIDDLGLYYVRVQTLSDAQKLQLLNKPWTPTKTYKFPITSFYGKKRSFCLDWLGQFPWLVYSAAVDGALCRYCVLFGHSTGKNYDRLDKLYKSPLRNWVKATTKFKDHQLISEFHKAAVGRGEDFRKVQEGQVISITQQLSDTRKSIVESNKMKLQAIIKTVVFCGKQNIALRGHRDDSEHINQGSGSRNPGNFQALLQFRVEAGDGVLGNHLANCARNATYRSKTVQNEIIEVLGRWIQDQIVAEINDAGAFALLADEASDSSNKEQLPLVIRFVDKQNNVREEFLGFFECSDGVTGQAIANLLMTAVHGLGLSMDDCQGQCYDGAGNMSGPCNGAAAIVRRQYPKAIYTHCAAHRLNLCVVNACKIQSVRNMFDTVGEITRSFEYSPKKEDLLVRKVKLLCPESRRSKLIDVCKTRWIQRLDGLEVFLEFFEAIVETMDEIKTNEEKSWNTESTKKAFGYYHAISNFQFIVNLTLCQEVLAFIKGLTVKIQRSTNDVVGVFSDIKNVLSTLADVRQKIDEHHARWFAKACQLCERLHVPVQKPRTCQIQRNRANTPATTPDEYYKRNLTVPFVDHLLSQLQSRFGVGDQEIAMQGLFAVPSVLLKSKDTWKESFHQFATYHDRSLPSPMGLDAEMSLWQGHWQRQDPDTVPSTASSTLKVMDHDLYANIAEGLKIFATLPVTTCECERNVSALRRLKTYMRSTMSQTRLTGLALLHVHYDMAIDVDEVIARFARLHPRKMELEHI